MEAAIVFIRTDGTFTLKEEQKTALKAILTVQHISALILTSSGWSYGA